MARTRSKAELKAIYAKSFGRKDGSRRGFKRGGRGRNRTPICRHPSKR